MQRTGWTKDPDVFFLWLSAIPFVGGGFNDAAIAEGLSEALMVYMLHTFNFYFLVFLRLYSPFKFHLTKYMSDPEPSEYFHLLLCYLFFPQGSDF